MTYIKLDDRFFTDAKACAVGMAGRALYVASLCYSGAHETDGLIAWAVVDTVADQAGVARTRKARAAVVESLVAEGMWVVEDAGYRIHNYTGHQRTKAEIEHARAVSRATTAAWRRAKSDKRVTRHHADGDTGRDTAVTSTEAEAEAERGTSSNGSSSAAIHVLPNEPKTNRGATA